MSYARLVIIHSSERLPTFEKWLSCIQGRLDLHVLEGITPGGDSEIAISMDIEGDPSAPATEATQAPLEPATALPLSLTDVSPFKGLLHRHRLWS